MMLNNKIIKVFATQAEAARYLIQHKKTTSTNVKGISAHIGKVCCGKRLKAYGYEWKFI